MILETIRIVADWLADPTHGVAARLADTPRDAGDAAPKLAAVLDETRHPTVARGQVPQKLTAGPVLEIAQLGEVTEDGVAATAHVDAEIELAIRYITRTSASAAGTRDSLYALRAAKRALRALNLNEHAAARRRNAVVVRELLAIRDASMYQEVDDITIVGGIAVKFRVRDLAPNP